MQDRKKAIQAIKIRLQAQTPGWLERAHESTKWLVVLGRSRERKPRLQ